MPGVKFLLLEGARNGPPNLAPLEHLEIGNLIGADNSAGGARANCLDDAISDSLPCQIVTGPVGQVRARSQWLQASQVNDLSALEGKIRAGRPVRWGWTNKAGELRILVAAADSPDRGRIVLVLDSYELDRFPSSDAHRSSPISCVVSYQRH